MPGLDLRQFLASNSWARRRLDLIAANGTLNSREFSVDGIGPCVVGKCDAFIPRKIIENK